MTSYTDDKEMKKPECPVFPCCVTGHEQLFEVFEQPARFARPMIVFDPRYAFAQPIIIPHRALQRAGAVDAARRRVIH